jgi:hypothetical protein
MGNRLGSVLVAAVVVGACLSLLVWKANFKFDEWQGPLLTLRESSVCVQRIRGFSYRTDFPITEFEKTTEFELSTASAELSFNEGELEVKRIAQCSGTTLRVSPVDVPTQTETYHSSSGPVKVKTRRVGGYVVGYEVTPAVGSPISFGTYGSDDGFADLVFLPLPGAILANASNGRSQRWLVYYSKTGNWYEFLLDNGLIFTLEPGDVFRVSPNKISIARVEGKP